MAGRPLSLSVSLLRILISVPDHPKGPRRPSAPPDCAARLETVRCLWDNLATFRSKRTVAILGQRGRETGSRACRRVRETGAARGGARRQREAQSSGTRTNRGVRVDGKRTTSAGPDRRTRLAGRRGREREQMLGGLDNAACALPLSLPVAACAVVPRRSPRVRRPRRASPVPSLLRFPSLFGAAAPPRPDVCVRCVRSLCTFPVRCAPRELTSRPFL